MNDNQKTKDAARYRLLRDYLLMNGFVIHQKIPEYQKPFVFGADFYGCTFDDAVDALIVHLPERDAAIESIVLSTPTPKD